MFFKYVECVVDVGNKNVVWEGGVFIFKFNSLWN